MRAMAILMSGLLLAAPVRVLAQEAPRRPQPLTPEEDAQLARKASLTPSLERFAAGGHSGSSIEAILWTLIILAQVAIANLVACPLGFVDSTQGKGFASRESMSDGCYRWIIVLGIPMYSFGYLIGLPCAPPATPAREPKPKEPTER